MSLKKGAHAALLRPRSEASLSARTEIHYKLNHPSFALSFDEG